MPTYDYICDGCGHKFEHFQSMTSAILKKCPQCNKAKLRRLIGSGAGVIFKGSGFYATDYRSDNYKSSAKSSASASTECCKGCEHKEKCKDEKTTAKSSGGKQKKA